MNTLRKHYFKKPVLGASAATLALGMIVIARRAEAIVTSNSGTQYGIECANAGVPIPPVWGGVAGGVFNPRWTISPRGTPTDLYPNFYSPHGHFASDGYTGDGASDIWYAEITGDRPGICVVNAHWAGEGGAGGPNTTLPFDLICQGTNGYACFWEGPLPAMPSLDAVTLADNSAGTVDKLQGGSAIAGNGNCTNCHAGQNAFINHSNQHATNLYEYFGWFPNASPKPYYEPIVAAGGQQNLRAETFPGYPYSTVGGANYSNGCLACHKSGGNAGAFPELSSNMTDYCSILEEVADRPAANGGMPSIYNNCTPASNCALETDDFVKAMLAVGCNSSLPSSKWGVFQIDRTGSNQFSVPSRLVANDANVTPGFGNGQVYPNQANTDVRRLKPTAMTSVENGVTWDHVWYGGGTTNGSSAWLKHKYSPAGDYVAKVASLWNPTPGGTPHYEVWEYGSSTYGNNPTKLLTDSSQFPGVVYPKGAPFGARRYDAESIVTYRGTDSRIQLFTHLSSNNTWSYTSLPDQYGTLFAASDPMAYKFSGDATSIVYNLQSGNNLIGEYRIHRGASHSVFSYTYGTTSIPVAIRSKTVPVGTRNANGVPVVYVSGTDGVYQLKHTGASDSTYQYAKTKIVTAAYIISSPAAYIGSDSNLRVVFLYDDKVYQRVNTLDAQGGDHWGTLETVKTHSADVLTSDPVAFVNSAGHNTIIYRTTKEKVFQLEYTGSSWTLTTLYDPASTP